MIASATKSASLAAALALAGVLSAQPPASVVEASQTAIYDTAQVDTPPKLMFVIKPKYPAGLDLGPATVVIDAVVDLDGVLRDPVVKSSTQKAFELPALQAVAKWKFKPARKGKEKVNVRMEFTVDFPAPKR